MKNQDGSIAKLAGPGGLDSFNGTTGYALCPLSDGAVQSQVEFARKAIDTWGFDGLKSDYVWSIPKCYNEAHQHERPEESTENQAVFYREVFQEMKKCNQDAFHLLCNCGAPQDYYSLPYVTQIPTADPTSVDQTRRRVKAYKALCGDYFPVTTDHNEIWYPSTIGTGGVLIEKRNMSGSMQAEYERWLKIAQKVELQKGRFIGDLYSYGFDPYETYVVEKDGRMYYGFYRDGAKYSPQGNPDIELKGLDPDKSYRIVDYVNDQVVATNVSGSHAVFSNKFSNYLLVYAEELSEPDPDLPSEKETVVEESDPVFVYEGNWNEESNSAFSGGSCKYTTSASAAVSLTFQGESVEWYGQNDTNFGTAEVYIDGELDEVVTCTGAAMTGVKLYEKTGLSKGEHTIRIVCKEPVIDIDRIIYKETETGEGEKPIAVTGVTLNHTELKIVDTAEYKLIPTITPENATNKNVTFTSSKPDIAYVDDFGTVTGKKNGEAVITVETEDGKKTANCTVIVAITDQGLKEELETAISDAEEIFKDKENYTKESWDIFKEAYDKALDRVHKADADELEQLLSALQSARDGLKENTSNIQKTALAAPTGLKVTAVNAGVQITFQKVVNAAYYEIYRKSGNGAAVKIISTSQTSYLDRNAPKGQSLTYTVVAVPASSDTLYIKSASSAGVSVTLPKENAAVLAAPAQVKAVSTVTGVQITFQTVKNAASYDIYRKTGNGTAQKIASTTTNTYMDQSVFAGQNLTYTVVAVPAGTSYTKSAESSAVSLSLPKAVSGLKVKAVSNGVSIRFKRVKGAKNYIIYRAAKKNGKYKKIKVLKAKKTSYIDKKTKKGKTYYYKVVTKKGTAFGVPKKGKKVKVKK